MKQTNTRSFFHHFLVLGTGTALYFLVGLVGTPIITRLVSPEAYGTRSMLSLYSQLGLVLCGLGLDQTLVHHYYDESDDAGRKALLHTCFRIPMVAAAALGGILLLFALLRRHTSTLPSLLLLIGNVMALLLYRYSTLALRLRYHSRAYSTVQIVQKAGSILLSVLLVLTVRRHHGELLILASIISTVFAAALGMFLEADLWHWEPDQASRITRKAMLAYGGPVMVAAGLHMAFQSMDRLFLDHFCTRSDVGIYAGAMNLIAVFSVLQTAFTTLWTNTAIDHHTRHPENTDFFQAGNAAISVLMLGFGALVVLCKDLIVLFLGPQYQAASALLPLLMFEPILYTISETTAVGIAIQKKPRYSVVVSAVSCLVNFAGNLVLAPVWGAWGAAASTAFAYVVFFVVRTACSQRVFPVRYRLPQFAVSLSALAAFAIYGSTHSFHWIQIPMFLVVILILFLSYRTDILRLLQDAVHSLVQKKE